MCVCSYFTLVEAVGGVLILLPADLAILVHVVVLPVFVHILLNVAPLSMLDPVVQLRMAHEAVLVCVDALHDLPAGGRRPPRPLMTFKEQTR